MQCFCKSDAYFGKYADACLSQWATDTPSYHSHCTWGGQWNIPSALWSWQQDPIATQNGSREWPGRKCQYHHICKCHQGNNPYKALEADSSTAQQLPVKLLLCPHVGWPFLSYSKTQKHPATLLMLWSHLSWVLVMPQEPLPWALNHSPGGFSPCPTEKLPYVLVYIRVWHVSGDEVLGVHIRQSGYFACTCQLWSLPLCHR